VPRLDVGELVQVDSREGAGVDPADQRHVGDAVLVADDVVARSQPGVEDAVQALRLAYVALDGVGGLGGREAGEVVCLALPVVRGGGISVYR
jgi:hypothetical protein